MAPQQQGAGVGRWRRGTGAVGWLFGPVLLVWFATIGALGASQVVSHPGVIQALSPVWGARFMLDHGGAAFLTLGGVLLLVALATGVALSRNRRRTSFSH